jgi:hypothetical protein
MARNMAAKGSRISAGDGHRPDDRVSEGHSVSVVLIAIGRGPPATPVSGGLTLTRVDNCSCVDGRIHLVRKARAERQKPLGNGVCGCGIRR